MIIQQDMIKRVYYTPIEAADYLNGWLYKIGAYDARRVHACSVRDWLVRFGLDNRIKRNRRNNRKISSRYLRYLMYIVWLLRVRGFTRWGAIQEFQRNMHNLPDFIANEDV